MANVSKRIAFDLQRFAGTFATEYTKTYTSFSGADIVATFGNTIIGELQAITYSVQREKAPVINLFSY